MRQCYTWQLGGWGRNGFNLAAISIFYGLAVLQLVLTYQSVFIGGEGKGEKWGVNLVNILIFYEL
jgi:hypothetical protein